MNRRAKQIRTQRLDALQKTALVRAHQRGHVMQRKHSVDNDIRKWACNRCGQDLIVQVPPHELWGSIHGVALDFDCVKEDEDGRPRD